MPYLILEIITHADKKEDNTTIEATPIYYKPLEKHAFITD